MPCTLLTTAVACMVLAGASGTASADQGASPVGDLLTASQAQLAGFPKVADPPEFTQLEGLRGPHERGRRGLRERIGDCRPRVGGVPLRVDERGTR